MILRFIAIAVMINKAGPRFIITDKGCGSPQKKTREEKQHNNTAHTFIMYIHLSLYIYIYIHTHVYTYLCIYIYIYKAGPRSAAAGSAAASRVGPEHITK